MENKNLYWCLDDVKAVLEMVFPPIVICIVVFGGAFSLYVIVKSLQSVPQPVIATTVEQARAIQRRCVMDDKGYPTIVTIWSDSLDSDKPHVVAYEITCNKF